MTSRRAGLTILEVLTGILAIAVIVAIAVPMWKTHELRTRRAQAIEALLAVQSAQDRFFGKHARYADGSDLYRAPPEGLGIRKQGQDFYVLELRRDADQLGYIATARAIASPDIAPDARCHELRLDQHGRRSAFDQTGADTSDDCWNRL
jgi:type IV pilus assembly protein PilE